MNIYMAIHRLYLLTHIILFEYLFVLSWKWFYTDAFNNGVSILVVKLESRRIQKARQGGTKVEGRRGSMAPRPRRRRRRGGIWGESFFLPNRLEVWGALWVYSPGPGQGRGRKRISVHF